MKRIRMLCIAVAVCLWGVWGCSESPKKALMKDAVEELRMMRQDMARMAGKDSAEYQIRASLMAFYSYLLKKEANIPYVLPAVETINDTERVKRFSYDTPDTYIRDVHYNGNRFDYIEIQDLSIIAYEADARASFKIVPYDRVVVKEGGEERAKLRPYLVQKRPWTLSPPVSPVLLKRLPAEAEEMVWKVNYKDAFIAGFEVPKK